MSIEYPKNIPVGALKNVLATLQNEAFETNRSGYARDLLAIAAYGFGEKVPANGGNIGYKALAANPKPVPLPTREEAIQHIQEAIDAVDAKNDVTKAATAINWPALIQLALQLLQQIFGGGPSPAPAPVPPPTPPPPVPANEPNQPHNFPFSGNPDFDPPPADAKGPAPHDANPDATENPNAHPLTSENVPPMAP